MCHIIDHMTFPRIEAYYIGNLLVQFCTNMCAGGISVGTRVGKSQVLGNGGGEVMKIA